MENLGKTVNEKKVKECSQSMENRQVKEMSLLSLFTIEVTFGEAD